MSNIVNILHTVFECCLFGGVIFIYMRMKDLEWLINERIKCLNEGIMEKFEDAIHNFYDINRYKIEKCKEELKEYSEITIALRENMEEVITKTDLLANSVEYWGTNPASLPLKEHKQLIKDVAQIKAELEAITAIVNHSMVRVGKRTTYLTKPWKGNTKKESKL